MKKEYSYKHIIIIIAVIVSITLIYFLSTPKTTSQNETTTTTTPYKKIIIESITNDGILNIRLLDKENKIEAGEVKVFNGDDEEINIGLCPQQSIIPDGKGTCLIDLSKCPSGRGFTVTGPGDGDEASCP